MISLIKLLVSRTTIFWLQIFSYLSNPTAPLARRVFFVQTVLIIFLTLIPIVNIANIIANSGENNISNDVVFWVDLADNILNGQSSLEEFFTRSFFYQHYIPLHIALELLNIYIFDWNVGFTLLIGFVLTLIKLSVLFDLFTFRFSTNPYRWWALPILSAVVFSNMEVTTFTGQNTATLIGMSMFGAVFSIWGIVRFPQRLKGVWLCLLGGFVSTWSFALGLIVWPITLVGMILLGYRKWKHYFVWLVGALISIFPYVYFLYFVRVEGSVPIYFDITKFLNIRFIVNMLGRPLVNLWTFENTRQYLLTGAVGIVLAGFCLLVLVLHLRKNLAVFVPPVLIFMLSVGGLWMASIGRPSLASWYITVAWPFWHALLGFAFLLLLQPVELGSRLKTGYELVKKWGALSILVIVALLYARSNIGNDIYGFLLYSRAPASASCLRYYEHAPTYCEGFLFQWPIQRPEYIFELGQPLAKNQLSTRGGQQQWRLQGDYILDRVVETRYANTAPVGWYEGLSGDRTGWAGTKRWQRLDLLLYSPNTIKWTLVFPDNLESAVLKTAVGLHQNGAGQANADGVTFRISVDEGNGSKVSIFEQHVPQNQRNWVPLAADLSSYRGKTVTLEFTSLPGENNTGDWAMYRSPVIDVEVNKIPNAHLVQPASYTPENTDVYPDFRSPGKDDLIWDGKDQNTWEYVNLETMQNQPGILRGSEDPHIQLQNPVNICLADYSHFYVKFAVPPGTPRVAQIFYQLNDGQPFTEERSFSFTVLGDGKVHAYTYPIRLLDADVGYNARLVNLRFDPASRLDNEKTIQFEEFGLLRGYGPGICD